LLTAGGVTGKISGLLIAVLLVVIATPVVGFTRNQILLTDKGRRLATTVAEVRALKEVDSAAFTSLFTAGYDARRLPATPALASPYHVGASNFWASLTDAERAWLVAVARDGAFPAGAALCRQDAQARDLFVLVSGQVVAYVGRRGKWRCIAVRGAGDIVGERAAIEVSYRSATVVAVTAVQALVIATSDFAVFLERHPRVLAVLEQQVYDRLVEERPAERASALTGIASGRPAWSGLNCSIFLADIAGFGGHRRNDTDRRFIRASMYAIVQRAFEASGVPWLDCHREDRGDGVLVIVPPATPTRLLVDPLTEGLATALADHNGRSADAVRIQLRVALHVGPVVSDPEGVSGESIILAARMLDAPVLKRQLAAEAADLGLIVSTYVYDTVVKHARAYSDPAQYRQVRVRLKESRLNAWMCLRGGQRSDLPRS
jgi:CRP-like cAMP-binding protein